jgi:hypothetical protein
MSTIREETTMARKQFSGGGPNRGGSNATTQKGAGLAAWRERNSGSGIDQSDRAPPADPYPGTGTTLGPNPGYLKPPAK